LMADDVQQAVVPDLPEFTAAGSRAAPLRMLRLSGQRSRA
jgi:hypothetical protein